ncbi:hypothetical protein [Chitinophaga sp. CF118]|uniref:hypothetical protein n=1 Tax=Chitinophaga sp. CF118 TaxID=1884367 RepID=UPI0015A6C350|nr:hypothetical protein [Chitinophaga sp. CF118]
MKTSSFILLLCVLFVALLLTFLVRKEQRSINKLSNTFIRLLRKFDSWQMMR